LVVVLSKCKKDFITLIEELNALVYSNCMNHDARLHNPIVIVHVWRMKEARFLAGLLAMLPAIGKLNGCFIKIKVTIE